MLGDGQLADAITRAEPCLIVPGVWILCIEKSVLSEGLLQNSPEGSCLTKPNAL